MSWWSKAKKAVKKVAQAVTYASPITIAYKAVTGKTDYIDEAIGKAYNDITGRTAEKEEAEAQKEIEIHNKDTILGQMDRELTIKKQEATEYTDAMRKQADQTQGALEQSYGSNQEQAYLETIAAEANFQNIQVNTSRAMGTMAAEKAASGLRNSGSINDVMSTEQAAASATESRVRESMNIGIASLVSGNEMARQQGMNNVQAVRTKADQTMAQFDAGSAYMDLFNWNKTRTTEASEMKVSYLDDAIDRSFSASGYFGDALKFVAGAASGAAAGAALGPAGMIVGAGLGGTSAVFA